MKEEKLACVLDRHSQSHSHARTTHPAIENDRENPAARDFRAIHAYVYTQIHLVACSALARHGALATATTPPLAGRDVQAQHVRVCPWEGTGPRHLPPCFAFHYSWHLRFQICTDFEAKYCILFFVQTENAVGER
jgi:hypothetical protein